MIKDTNLRISVGCCVKGMADTLRRTFDSLLNQTIANESEIVFITTKMSDPAYGIFREYLDRLTDRFYYVTIAFDHNNGLAFARQKAVDNSHSPYIVWIDGDHVVPPHFLERGVQFMDANQDVGACNTIPLWIGEKPHQVLEGITWAYYTLSIKHKNLDRLGSAGGFYRVKAIQDAGGYDSSFKYAAEDGYITYRIFKKGWKLKIDHDNYYYHIIRPRWMDVGREYFNWGRGAALENRVNRDKLIDKRLLKFPFSPITGLKYGILYKRALPILNTLYPLPEHSYGWRHVFLNIPYYTWKRYMWLFGYVKGLKK